MEPVTSKVELVPCDDLAEAKLKADAEASRESGNAFPAIEYTQGARKMYSSAFPFRIIRERLQSTSAEYGDDVEAVRQKTNRPEDPVHSQAIARYVQENMDGSYILPPLTLNIAEPLKFFSVGEDAVLRPGFLVVPVDAIIDITDGQHRRSGIQRAFANLTREEKSRLDRNAVAVMLTSELAVAQVHQDFADASKTKALPPSQLSVYDRRNPANGIVMDVIDRCPLFRGKVDSTGQRLSKKSTAVCLTNQVRQLIKELMGATIAAGDAQFEELAKRTLVNAKDARYQAALEKFCLYINDVTLMIPIWQEVARMDDPVSRQRMPQLRETYVCLSATGMNMIGRLGHRLMRDFSSDWRSYAAKLAGVDWRRDASLWQGNLIASNGSLQATNAALRGGYEELCAALGLPTGSATQGTMPFVESTGAADQVGVS